jgi:hypothetical protein
MSKIYLKIKNKSLEKIKNDKIENIFIIIIQDYFYFDLLEYSKWTTIKRICQCNKVFNKLYWNIIRIATYKIIFLKCKNICIICGKEFIINNKSHCFCCDNTGVCIDCTFIISKPLTIQQTNSSYFNFKDEIIKINDRLCLQCCLDDDIIYTNNPIITKQLKEKYITFIKGSELIDRTINIDIKKDILFTFFKLWKKNINNNVLSRKYRI